MKQAIQKAKEQGYDPIGRFHPDIRNYAVPLDPEFWQALGKAMGWGAEMIMIDEKGHPKEWCYFQHCSVCGEQIVDEEDGCPDGCVSDNAYVESWVYHWHRFIDHLAEGKDVESFFDKLEKEI